MNPRQPTLGRHAALALVAAAGCMATLQPVRAATTFTTDSVARQIFCDMPALAGEFHRTSARYTSRGTCVEMETVKVNDGVRNRSEFGNYNQSKDIWRADWTAEGSYDLATKVATETITLPAPTVDTYAPANRPYGRFVSRMVCATDPWLETRAQCTAIVVTAQGNLGSMEKTLRQMQRPFTSTEKEPMRNALIAQQASAMARLNPERTGTTAQAGRGAYNPGLASRGTSTDLWTANPAPSRGVDTRPALGTAPVSTVPASAPAPYGTRSARPDWGKAAPSALGGR